MRLSGFPINVPTANELLNAFAARWRLNTNTIRTCYGDFNIFCWDFFWTTSLPIFRDMYSEFTLDKGLIIDKILTDALRLLFQKW